ncbi:CBM21 domain-containing protein [Eleftheria terrae]|nr:CBM21 domain-containing protein [Eleftheria terrae]
MKHPLPFKAFFFCTFALLLGSAASAADEVQLLRAHSIETMKAQIYHQNFSFQVKAANLGQQREVIAHLKGADGQWFQIPLRFASAAEPGQDIWVADHWRTGYWGRQRTLEYAIEYKVDGNSYWDKRQGDPYRQDLNSGSRLQDGIQVLNRYQPVVRVGTSQRIGGSVTVRNLGVDKAVTVHYSTDGWRSRKTVAATFSPYFWFSYSYFVRGSSNAANPNELGLEEWNYWLDIGQAKQVEVAVHYTVDGHGYWDNNGGRGYTVLIERN